MTSGAETYISGMGNLALLSDRGVVILEGDDRVAFLQGLVSNDVEAAAPGQAVWAALLTPQGKWLADFFVFADGDRLLLDCERAQTDMVLQRLSRYRLRMKVSLSVAPETQVYVAWPEPGAHRSVAAPDPRLAGFAWRILSTEALPQTATEADWDTYRLKAGLPEGSRDMEAERSVLLEAGFDELHGVSWSKGCYMGQELTARTKYRGLVKRRLVPVSIHGPVPPPGTTVLRDGADVGTMRSGRGNVGLAVLRLDAIGSGTLRCGEAELVANRPDWMQLPQAASGS